MNLLTGEEVDGVSGKLDFNKIDIKNYIVPDPHMPGDGPVGQTWAISMKMFSDTQNGPIGTEGVLMGASALGTPINSLSDFFFKCFNFIFFITHFFLPFLFYYEREVQLEQALRRRLS